MPKAVDKEIIAFGRRNRRNVADKNNPLAKGLNTIAGGGGLEGARGGMAGGGPRGTAARSGPVEVARRQLETEMYEAGAALKKFPKGPTGMTPDAVKFSAEYREAKSSYDKAFQTLRSFNKKYKP